LASGSGPGFGSPWGAVLVAVVMVALALAGITPGAPQAPIDAPARQDGIESVDSWAAFVLGNWGENARSEVAGRYAELAGGDAPGWAMGALNIFGAPQSTGEAAFVVALSVIPGGKGVGIAGKGLGIIGKAGKIADKVDDARDASRFARAARGEAADAGRGVGDELRFTQGSVRRTFGHGEFAGDSLKSVSGRLRMGEIHPSQMPIQFVERGGNVYSMNSRSMWALRQADMQPTHLIDVTGDSFFEGQLTRRLGELGTSDVPGMMPRLRGGW
jgi:hypothetical protein